MNISLRKRESKRQITSKNILNSKVKRSENGPDNGSMEIIKSKEG